MGENNHNEKDRGIKVDSKWLQTKLSEKMNNNSPLRNTKQTSKEESTPRGVNSAKNNDHKANMSRISKWTKLDLLLKDNDIPRRDRPKLLDYGEVYERANCKFEEEEGRH